MDALQQDQKKKLKVSEKTWGVAEKLFGEKKCKIEQGKTKYLTAHKMLDEAISLYDNPKEPDSSPEKKKRQNQKITQLLKECKETENRYRNIVYEAKNARMDYIKTNVFPFFYNSFVGHDIGSLSKIRRRKG